MCEGCGCEQPKSLYAPDVCTIVNIDLKGNFPVVELSHDNNAGEFSSQSRVLLSLPGIGEECYSAQSLLEKPKGLFIAIAPTSSLSHAIVSRPIGSDIGIRGPFGNDESLQIVQGKDVWERIPSHEFSSEDTHHSSPIFFPFHRKKMGEDLKRVQRPTIALCTLDSCDGCWLIMAAAKANLGLMADKIDILDKKAAMPPGSGRYSIAIIEGSVSNSLHEAFVKSLRARSDIVVAAGSCANFGAKNQFQKQASSGAIDISDVVETAIDKIIPVDHSVYGCPITPQELSKVVKAIIMGATPFIPNYPVCSECKMQALECMFDKGHACYGPVTRAGCNAICLQNDISCDGCRGTIPAANTKQLSTIISQRNLRLHNTDKRFGLFGMELENINA